MAIRMNGLSLELLSHPGETLKEVLDSNNMTQKELSARIGITPKHLNLIISGKQDISTETAFKLEKVFSLSASFWNNLQRQYDEDKMSILEEQQIFEEEKSVYDANVYSQIVALGYLQRETKLERKIIQLRGFLGVSNLLNVKPAIAANALFRKSTKVATNDFALAAWMKICEIETDAISVQTSLDIEKLKSKLVEIKNLNTLDPNVIVENLERIFAECGVAFAVVKNIKGAPVQGFIRKINNKVRLCVTLRNKYADIFWFTLFHEIGHLLDTQNEFFVDFRSVDRGVGAEKIADEFATQQLINKTAYVQFVREANFSRPSVQRFANDNGLLPGILVGRLQHDGHLNNSQLNDMRVQYIWAS